MSATPLVASLAVKATLTELLVYQPLVPCGLGRLSVVFGLTLSILKLSDSVASVLPATFTLQNVIWCVPSPETEKALPV